FTAPRGKPIISATATDPSGNTSEFSGLRQATLTMPAYSVPRVSGPSLVFSAATDNRLALDDTSAGPLSSQADWDLSLSVTAGTLTLSGTAGLSGTGNGTGVLHYRGTIPALDAALEGLRYTWPAGHEGLATMTLAAHSDGAAPLERQVLLNFFQVSSTADSGP